MGIYHVRIDTPPWVGASHARLDDTLAALGSTCVDVRMDDLDLETDGDHFTRTAQRTFHARLMEAVEMAMGTEATVAATAGGRTAADDAPPSRPRLLVLADSAVDFHNRIDGEWTGWASADLRDAAQQRANIDVLVDAVCGSGFVSRAHAGDHFHARLSHHLRSGFRGAVLLVGGWNDARTGRMDETIMAMARCVASHARYT